MDIYSKRIYSMSRNEQIIEKKNKEIEKSVEKVFP